jgi:hypothetical protein
MMPAVVGFWQLPEDENEFLVFLQGTGTVLALPDRSVDTKEELVPQPIAAFLERHNPNQLLFGLERHVRVIRVEEYSAEGRLRFVCPYMEPCVIAYSRGRLLGRKLAMSNLSAYWNYRSADRPSSVENDPEFVRWGKKVMAWVRRATPEHVECNGHPYRATPQVQKAASEGQLEVVLY